MADCSVGRLLPVLGHQVAIITTIVEPSMGPGFKSLVDVIPIQLN